MGAFVYYSLALYCHTGTAETATHFVIYEHIKKLQRAQRESSDLELLDCMWAAALAKLTASPLCYPHGECSLATAAEPGGGWPDLD